MLLDELKKMIKEFETVLVKDERFKDDVSFKNQVKIIYSKDKKPTNLMAPILLGNLSSINNTDEITKLKNRIKYLEKIENIPCNCEEQTSDSLFESCSSFGLRRQGPEILNSLFLLPKFLITSFCCSCVTSKLIMYT
jgi:hypothetical protein